MKTHLPRNPFTKLYSALLICIFLLSSFLSFSQQAPKDYYWVGGSGSWQSPTTHWATTSGGAVFYQSVPSQFDRVIFDINSFTAPGQEVTTSAEGFCGEFRSKDVLPGVKFTTSKHLNIYQGFSIDSNMIFTQTSANLIVLAGGFSIGKNANVSINGGNHSINDGLFLVGKSAIYYNNGTLTVSSGSFTIQTGATFSHNSTINVGTGLFTVETGASYSNNGQLQVSNGHVLIKRQSTFYQNGNFNIGVGNFTLESKTTYTQAV